MIYIEEAVADHRRTRRILSRIPDARRIPCSDWREVFERPRQSFRLQKRRPALILARRDDDLVSEAPPGWTLGGRHDYRFSPMLNCIYDCRYCYLQGLFGSAAYVVFVNYEDFMEGIDRCLDDAGDEEAWFFAGHDSDNLALEPVTRFAETFLPFFAERPRARLELRTKSTQVHPLLDLEPVEGCVVAFSVTPSRLAERLDREAPPVERRLAAARRLQEAGWRVGLRLDPLIWHEGFEASYRDLFRSMDRELDLGSIHSVTLGPFRLQAGHWERMRRLHPDEELFAGPLEERDGHMGFRRDLEAAVRELCLEELSGRVPDGAVVTAAHSA